MTVLTYIAIFIAGSIVGSWLDHAACRLIDFVGEPVDLMDLPPQVRAMVIDEVN